MDIKEAEKAEGLFIDYLRFEKRFSEHTVIAYSTDVMQYREFLKKADKDILSVRSQNVKNWIIDLLEHEDTPRTVNRKISTLKSLYKFLLRKKYIESNPMQKVIAPKYTPTLPNYVSEAKMEDLFENTNFPDTFEGIRDKTILELFYATGIRLSELLAIEFQDLDFQLHTIKVIGKREKERIIPLSPLMEEILFYYIDITKKTFGKNAFSQNFFVTLNNKKINPAFLYKIVRKYLDESSGTEKRSPHVLRHTFATHLLNSGADLNAIKTLLGHSSLAATQVYTHTSVEKLKQIYKQAHPRA